MNSPAALAVSAQSELQQSQAAALAQQLDLPLLAPATDPAHCPEFTALLVVQEVGLALMQTGAGAPGPVQVDFGGKAMRHRRKGGHNELLGKAVGIGRKTDLQVLDATAGLGRDAFVLADLGCRVTLCEREPVIAAMLDAAIRYAVQSGDRWLLETISRMQLLSGDATTLPAEQLVDVDVIVLDPMFPQRDKHAAVKKEMALFQQVLSLDSLSADSEALLQWALAQDVARVVVKRPRKAPVLGSTGVSHTITGKAVRYDVFVKRGLQNAPEVLPS